MSRQDPAALITLMTEAAIANLGHCYVYGGAPGPDLSGCWDCSSMQNAIIGLIAGQSIPDFPDGSYDGTEHGPSTIGWLGSQGTITGSVERSQAQPGDLAVWRTHMGMCISNTEMVSAANPTDGTIRSQIDGFIQGEQLVILRLAVIGPGGITLPIPTIGGTKQLDQITRQVAQSSQSLVWKRMQVRRILTGRY